MASQTLRFLWSHIGNSLFSQKAIPSITTCRFRHIKAIQKPEPGHGKQYRRYVPKKH